MNKLLGLILSVVACAAGANSSHAVTVPFNADLSIVNDNVTFIEQSIVSNLRTEGSGTGRVSVSSSSRDGVLFAGATVSVGPGAGNALVTGTVVSTFDLLFPSLSPEGFIIDIIVPSLPGRDLRLGETASLEYDLSILAGNPANPQVDLFGGGLFSCADILCNRDAYTAGGDFIVVGDSFLFPNDNFRLPVTITAAFTLQATAVPEPGVIAMLGFGLCLTMAFVRRRLWRR